MEEHPPSTRNRLLVWAERLFIVGAIAFILYRFGPQLGALTGIDSGLGPSPEYRFTALDGSFVDSNDLNGKVVVLNFWATWCGPCRLEMPSLQSLHEDRIDDGGIVVGLATDVGPGSVVEEFLAERDITYPVGRATRNQIQAFGGIPMIPTTFIIDRKGVIRHKITGYAAPPVLRVAVNRLLGEESG
jgi:thiol-disulfide isomerase/thioredoxin